MKVWVSACLLGESVRWDGGHCLRSHPALAYWQAHDLLLPFCPECAGGLPVPRPAAEIVSGSGVDVWAGRAFVQTQRGDDLTAAFMAGARKALVTYQQAGAVLALMKEKSPSCGSQCIYDGCFSGRQQEGEGVTTALFRQQGIPVFHEGELDQAWQYWQCLQAGTG